MVRYDFTGSFYSIVNFLIHCPRRINYTCRIIFICFFPALLSAQENVTLSPPNLKFLNDRLIIKYDITGYEISDRFRVWIEITDSTGNKITARSIYGDIGDEVTGGFQKQIIWDLAADSAYLNADINIEIFATRKLKPPPLVAEKVTERVPELTTDDEATGKRIEKSPVTKPDTAVRKKKAGNIPEMKTDSAITKRRNNSHAEIKTDSVITGQMTEIRHETKTDTLLNGKITKAESELTADVGAYEKKKSSTEKTEKSDARKSVKTGSELLLSTVCPGWGLTRLSGGKPYWMLGVVGYGCIASSYYLNTLSYSNYEKYTNSSDINKTDEMDAYYNTGKKQYTASNVLALSAIALWVADLGFTWIKASKMKHSAASATSGSLSVVSSYDHSAKAPLISIQYTF